LKNNLRVYYQEITPAVLSYIKSGAEKALVDRHDLIRSVSGTIITTIVTRGGIMHWPEILQRYMEMAESPDPILQEV
jgi:transportin-1